MANAIAAALIWPIGPAWLFGIVQTAAHVRSGRVKAENATEAVVAMTAAIWWAAMATPSVGLVLGVAASIAALQA